MNGMFSAPPGPTWSDQAVSLLKGKELVKGPDQLGPDRFSGRHKDQQETCPAAGNMGRPEDGPLRDWHPDTFGDLDR